MKRPVLALGVGLLCAGGAHLCQRGLDPGRRTTSAEYRRDTVASGPLLRVASSGFHVLVADILWMRTVLAFGEIHDENTLAQHGFGDWLSGSILAISELDPQWSTPYQWGGLMLEVAEEPQAAKAVYQRGVEAFPDEYRFWFALGMLEYFSFEDTQAASQAMARAAECPGAPEWFAVASLAYGSDQETEEAGIQFLRSQLDATPDPDLRASIESRIQRLEHQRLERQIAQVKTELEAQLGAILSISALEQAAGRALPQDPMGVGWIVDVDGVVRSQVIAEERAAKDLRSGRALMTNARLKGI